MAARRLVIVMLVLLGLSTLAAAFIHPPARNGTPTTIGRQKPPPSSNPAATGSAGRLVTAAFRISNAKPKTVSVSPGDELRLAVSGPFGDSIEIPGFGLTETMSLYAPAHFDLIVDRPGRFAVRAVDAGLLAGWILSAPRSPTCPRAPARPGSARATGCGRPGGPSAPGGGRSGQRPSGAGGPQRQ